MTLATDEILETLDLSRAEPGTGFLQALFARFNARVAFETASKIVRDRRIADPADKPRRPELFWSEHRELGTGGTCFARVAAFEHVLSSLGFASRRVLGRVGRDSDHAAIWIDGNGPLLCDVGFPLPQILPARETRIETGTVDLQVSRTPRGFRIDLSAGVPEGPRALEIFDAEVSPEAYEQRWRGTFRPGSRFLSEVLLRRQEDSRVVSYARGEVRVDDRHSRLTVPIEPPRASRLADIFQIDASVLQSAFDIVGEPEPSSRRSLLTSYLETSAEASAAFARISSVSGYRELFGGVAQIVQQQATESGWSLGLAPLGDAQAPGGAAPLQEEVSVDTDRQALRIRRRSGASASDSEFRVERRAEKTYLVRELLFETPREDLLRADSARGRLAGTLAADLLAWARLVGRTA